MKPTARKLLASANSKAMLITNITNIRYLSGIPVDSAILVASPRGYVLFADVLEQEMARATAPKIVKVRDSADIEQFFRTIRMCAFEAESMTVERLERYKKRFKNTKFVQKKGIVERFRRSKDKDELRALKKALSITNTMLNRIPAALKSFPTERQLAWKIETWARELGAEGLSFDAIVAYGTNSSRPHHHPTDRKLQKNQIVQIDIGAKYKGYCGDRSEVFFTGKPTAAQVKALEAVRDAKDTAKKAVKAGVSVRELDRIARDVLKKYGMADAFVHSLGHGVGLDIHEGVSLSQRATDDHLLKNEVITIEPGVYFPGKFGIRLEDMVFVP